MFVCMFVCLHVCLSACLFVCQIIVRCPAGFSISQVLRGSFLVAAIGYLEHIAIGQSFAVKGGYQIDNSQVGTLYGIIHCTQAIHYTLYLNIVICMHYTLHFIITTRLTRR